MHVRTDEGTRILVELEKAETTDAKAVSHEGTADGGSGGEGVARIDMDPSLSTRARSRGVLTMGRQVCIIGFRGFDVLYSSR